MGLELPPEPLEPDWLDELRKEAAPRPRPTRSRHRPEAALVNLAAYPKERRPAMSAGELVGLFRIPWRGVATPDAVALMAGCLEGIEEDVLVGFVADASDLAADLEEPPEVRSLAAALAATCESILRSGLADWDAVFALLDAGKATASLTIERTT